MIRYTFTLASLILAGCQLSPQPAEEKPTHQMGNKTEVKTVESTSNPTNQSSSEQVIEHDHKVKAIPNESLPIFQSANNKMNDIKELNPLVLFRRLANEKIWLNFQSCKSCSGEFVKLQLHLTDTGFIEHYKIIKSSGHKELEDAAIVAIRKAEPIPMPNLAKSDLHKAKTLVINFAPNK